MKIQKLLWIVSDPERIRAANSYVTAIGVATKIETSIQQALQGISTFQPDGVVLSVEILKHTSLQAAQLIEATYGTTVALFSETGSISDLPSEVQRLVIIAPASGPKILMKLQSLIDRKTSSAPQVIRGTGAQKRNAHVSGSALETAIFTAFDKLCKTAFQIGTEGIPELKKMAAVGVKSSLGTGYLIANFNSEMKESLDLSHLELLPQPGMQRLELHSHYVSEWDLEDDQDILGWASEEALFWAPIHSAEGKLNVIFIEAPLASDHLRPSPVARMASIELASLPTDGPIPVALLLWLSINQKLIPYVKANTALLADQKDRLLRNGIELLEVHKEDEVELLKYLIRHDLERTLQGHIKPSATETEI